MAGLDLQSGICWVGGVSHFGYLEKEYRAYGRDARRYDQPCGLLVVNYYGKRLN